MFIMMQGKDPCLKKKGKEVNEGKFITVVETHQVLGTDMLVITFTKIY
jgi:hypothetical protein